MSSRLWLVSMRNEKKSAACQDRTDDLRIMRPTRYRLRQSSLFFFLFFHSTSWIPSPTDGCECVASQKQEYSYYLKHNFLDPFSLDPNSLHFNFCLPVTEKLVMNDDLAFSEAVVAFVYRP